MGWLWGLPNDPPWACWWGRPHRWFSDGDGSYFEWRASNPDVPTIWPARGRPTATSRYPDERRLGSRHLSPTGPVDRDFRCLRCGAVAANRSDREAKESQERQSAHAALQRARDVVAAQERLDHEQSQRRAIAAHHDGGVGRVSFPSLALMEGGMSLAEQVVEWVTDDRTDVPHHHDSKDLDRLKKDQ